MKTKIESKYTIQVYASRKRGNAISMVEELKKNGFEDAFIWKHVIGGKAVFRVRVGRLERSEIQQKGEET